MYDFIIDWKVNTKKMDYKNLVKDFASKNVWNKN